MIVKRRPRTPPMTPPKRTLNYKQNPVGAKPKGQLITVAEYCRKSGRSDPSIRGLIQRDELQIGKHYWRRPGRRGIMLEYEAVEDYFRGF